MSPWRQVLYGAESWCSLRPGPGNWTNVGGVPATDPSQSRTCGESDLTIRVLDPAVLTLASLAASLDLALAVVALFLRSSLTA